MLELEKPNLAIIVAMTKDGLIGSGNNMPWHIYDEFQHFKELTKGNTVIMGERTFNSIVEIDETRYKEKNKEKLKIRKPEEIVILPNRNKIVISEYAFGVNYPGINVVTGKNAIEDGLKLAKEFGKKIYIAGGRSIYSQMLPFVDELNISWIHGDHEGDVYFPYYDENKWNRVETRHHKDFTFKRYERKERVNYLDKVRGEIKDVKNIL